MREQLFNLNVSKSVRNPATLKSVAGLLFRPIKERVLGKRYALNLNLVGPAESKKLNFEYRRENRSTDILSFSLSKNEGEIYLDLTTSRAEAIKFNRPFGNFLLFLFIHGLVHLKGFKHGSRMESVEEKIRQKFRV